MLGYSQIISAFSISLNTDGHRFTKACVLVLLAATLSLLVKSFGFKGAPVFLAAVFCSAVFCFEDVISGSISLLGYFAEVGDVTKYSEACVKVIGIGYLSGISQDTCREIGEAGAAKCIGIVTRLELIALSAPFVKEIFDSALLLVGE